ncbi:MAG: TetR/AcrR family transcriptional regulator [Hyphomonadaceae bacterium]|nr:TetR/AcrR family transcriptional regulator [Hyphomonadaceae bacterium]
MENDRSIQAEEALDAATQQFWRYGYTASSMRDLLRVTGLHRTALYSSFGGKSGLFLACLDAYCHKVVSPAFAQVETEEAGLVEVRAYFEHQIAAAEADGLPGPGCLIANSMTELSPHDSEVQARVEAHLERLRAGFSNALSYTAQGRCSSETISELADFLAINSQALWAHSRQVNTAVPLRAHAACLVSMVEERLAS